MLLCNMSRKKLLLIDSFALIFRAYYAYPPTLSNKDGKLTNAVYGFTSLLLDVLDRFKPEYVVAVFDPQTPLIRQSEMVLYKANRKETDQELLDQIPLVKDVLDAFDIPVLKVDGYEADDVIGTLVKNHTGKDLDIIIVTGDQDIFQLIDNSTKVFLAGRKFSESKLYDAKKVFEKLSITPEQVTDYKALKGDTSDNIPGVAGIGDKSAIALIEKYNTIEEIYKNIEDVEPRYKKKLVENYEMAVMSKKLATIETKVPLSFDISSSILKTLKLNEILQIFEYLQFNSLTKRIKTLVQDITPEAQTGLFEDSYESTLESTLPPVQELEINALKKDSKDIYVTFNLLDDNAAPIEYNCEEIYVTQDGEIIFSVEVDKLTNLITFIQDNNIRLIGVEIKKLFHVLINNQINIENITFEDIGFINQIYYGGQLLSLIHI